IISPVNSRELTAQNQAENSQIPTDAYRYIKTKSAQIQLGGFLLFLQLFIYCRKRSSKKQ
ncbi:hypothetical protein, partial [Neglectibacter timonensis]|uniref:hypothetical protein n=1 Tax=Neglectibacter timonensis TaxID=1776382 RepID=UPI00248F101C